MTGTCHECGNEYVSVAQHWVRSSCNRKPMSEHQIEVAKGLTLGDGHVRRTESQTRPCLSVKMINKEYLEYLSDNVFPVLGGDVRLTETARESAERAKESGFSEVASEERYSDLHRFRVMCHPDLEQYLDWYSSGSKVFPADLELTPTALKHYFVGDGSFSEDRPSLIINITNEKENGTKIQNMFERAGFEDFVWYTQEGPGYSEYACVRFRQSGIENFFDYIGRDPLPGFEYKFP